MKLVATWKDSKMDRESARNLNTHFAKLKEGKYTIEVKKYSDNRSNGQNRLMWDVYRQVSDQTGYETDEIHAMMGQKFLLKTDCKSPYVISTTKLTTKEFTDYLDRVVRFFNADCGLTVTMPEDR